MKQIKGDWIKALAIFATGLGVVAGLLGDWAKEKEQDRIIEEKVNEALAKREESEHEES